MTSQKKRRIAVQQALIVCFSGLKNKNSLIWKEKITTPRHKTAAMPP